jgi:hypothetical protein
MARIQPVKQDNWSPAIQVACNRHLEQYGEAISNTRATLAYSLPAFEVYSQLNLLYGQVENLLGQRLTDLFAYSIARSSDCRICIAYFRKKIAARGDNPDQPDLNPDQAVLIEFGSSIARYKGKIADHVYNRAAKLFAPQEIVLLVAFAGQLLATAFFNNVLETDIDSHLQEFELHFKCC